MPTITIRDDQGAEILKTDLSDKGLGKYLKSAASLRGALPLVKAFSEPLADGAGGRELAIALDKDIPVGKNGELTIGGGASVAIGVHPSGGTIFSASDLQAPVRVPNGTAYTSLALEATLKVGLAGTKGHIGFGFLAGTAVRYAYFHPFNIVANGETVKSAVVTMLSHAVFPAVTDDLTELPVGAFVSLAGDGELSFSGEASLSSTTSLLATPGLPIVGAVALTHGASLNVQAEWTAKGEFELRVSRPSVSQLHLTIYRRRGRSLQVSAAATTGLAVNVRDSDLLAMLIRAISPDPEADLLMLVEAGLEDEPILAIQQAIKESIDRSLTIAAQLQVSALRDDEALFAYDIDVQRLDAESRAAVEDALHGRLTALGRVAGTAGGPVRLVASAAKQLRERNTSWRINLLGILNFASFVQEVQKGSLAVDEVSGTLIAADENSARRIFIKSGPLSKVNAEKLRKMLLESVIVTAAYQASRTLGIEFSLTANHLYVEQRGKTKRRELEDHYRALIGLGLCDETEQDARLGTEAEFGSSILVIENRFEQAACEQMFLDAAGNPHTEEHYETVARQAFLALIPDGDPERAFRRFALESDATWSRLRALGPAIGQALPSHIRNNAIKLHVVRGDVFTILWWAGAMNKAATELAEMRKFLGQRDATTLIAEKDAAFLEARKKLSDALAEVVATTEARFDDPWDALAMDAAAARLGTLESSIVSPRFAAHYTDADTPSAALAPATRSRAARAPVLTRAEPAERDWTSEERDVFARHVVNLRAGKLSGDGSFNSSVEQVERIFSAFIPEYASKQRERNRRPRVVFYAHGGLVDERGGLLPVLRRQRFWALNDIYPVYFVWETGLRETLRDIVSGAVAPSRAGRGPLTDAAIERVARPAGKRLWDEMKDSAEKASAAGAGARLVAELAGKLWNRLNGELEFHAIGHSAGAIFHAHFLPVLVSQPAAGLPSVSVRTLQFLAPAITTDLFKSRLRSIIGAGQPITRLTIYTMLDELEQKDDSVKPYGKSLLYLVSQSFEDSVPTPLLGLQRSLNRDLELIRFFGLAGTEKVADMIFSRTDRAAAPADRSESITHGGFDDDIPTMTSVVRRVLDMSSTTTVVDYFEDAISGFDEPSVGISRAVRAVTRRSREAVARAAGAPSIRRATAKKPWTVMVWMAGDNNLESFGDKDLAEMKRIGSTDDINVTVQFDSMRDDRTRRYAIRQGGHVDADVVQELGETNTGDPAVASDFFSWAIDRYPAERLLGVIWNHGSGIDETDIYARVAAGRGLAGAGETAVKGGGVQRNLVRAALTGRHRRALFETTVTQATQDRAIAYDDTSKDFLDNIELKKVLTDVKKQTGRVIDVLGFDACLMNMIEVAYQLKGSAGMIVGSEELEPGEGWPYDRVLERLASHPTLTGPELGAAIVDQYINSYQSGSITQSALDLSRLEAVAAAVNTLALELTKAIGEADEYVAVTKTLHATQRFDMADFVDLGHFCLELSKRSKESPVKTAAKATIGALTGQNGLVVAERHKGSGVSNATGAAIYFPQGPVNKVYAKLDFAKATAWQKFLEAYHGA